MCSRLMRKTGKPIASNHVVVVYGATEDDIRWQTHSAEAKTGVDGTAVLPNELMGAKYMQVWIDWHQVCVEHPNLEPINVQGIATKGVVMNHCSRRTFQAIPGVLTVAAREETFFEKMSH